MPRCPHEPEGSRFATRDALCDVGRSYIAQYSHGRLRDGGWGAALGYPGIDLDPDGPAVDVEVFESVELRANWPRLDDFEGPSYRRVVTPVSTAEGPVAASIYVLADGPPPAP